MKDQKTVKVSVVVPIYNVERYIRRCLRDLTQQTLRDIEIICVDDGSTDGTDRLLADAASKDSRITVIRQQNAGAGIARNTGLTHARGEYVFFCDPDDSCSRHMLKGMYRRARQTDADIVIAGKCIVDAESGKFLAKFGFHRNIWALKQPFSGQDMAEHVFTLAKSVPWDKLFRRGFIEDNGLRFQNISRSNDVFFVDMALALAKRIALVPRAYYRYSQDRVGSLQFCKDKTPLVFLDAYVALEEGLRARGVFRTFAESYMRAFFSSVLFNLRKFQNPENVVSCYAKVRDIMLRLKPEVDLSEDCLLPVKAVSIYREMLEDPLPDSAMSILLGSKWQAPIFDDDMFAIGTKKWRFRLKQFVRHVVPVPVRELVKFLRVRMFNDTVRYDKNRRNGSVTAFYWRNRRLVVDFMEVSQSSIKFELSYSVRGKAPPDALPGDAVLACDSCGTSQRVKVVSGRVFRLHGNAGRMGRRFSCKVPLVGGTPCSLSWVFGDGLKRFSWKFVKYGLYAPLISKRATSYFCRSGWIVRCAGEKLDVLPDTFTARARCILSAMTEAVIHPHCAAVLSCAARVVVAAMRLVRRRPLWLVSDWPDRADDNARAFFEYVCSLRSDKSDRKCVFAVKRSSSYFKEISKIGSCVDMDSVWYRLLFLSSDAIISAYRTSEQRCPFTERYAEFLKWFFAVRYRFFFIRHGIGSYDMAYETGRHHINARVMTAASPYEYQADLDTAYGYTTREIKLCGMARYDGLYDRRGGFVTFMPTWRAYLTKGAGTDQLEDEASFPESSFCKCYAAVFSDEDFVSRCEALGYKVRLMPHPNMRVAVAGLRLAPSVSVIEPEARYRDVFATSDMVVTDYSSVAFDMAYLKKPVLYYQFDEDEFFDRQYQKGFFDWRRDGFGEVLTDAASLKEAILSYLASGCKMKPEYQKRVDDFFAFTDRNNCKRVYETILEAVREDGIG